MIDYRERCERLELALMDACKNINILRGNIIEDEIPYEYYYFTNKHNVYGNSERGRNRFEVGQLIATKVHNGNDLTQQSQRRYVGEIIRVEVGELMLIVSFDKETRKLARKENKYMNDLSLEATAVYSKDVWSNEMNFSDDSYYFEEKEMRGVKVVQFQSPNIAIVRYSDGRLRRMDVNFLKCESTRQF